MSTLPVVNAAGAGGGARESGAAPTPLACTSGSVQIGQLWVGAGAGCGSGGFGVMWAENLSHWSSTTSYNFTFSIVAIAEITPAGAIDELSPLEWAPNGTTAVTRTLHGVNFTVNQTSPVAPTSGPWIPGTTIGAESTWSPWSGGWIPGNATTGNVSVQTVFHLATNAANGTGSHATNSSANATGGNRTNASYSLEFDLAVHDWPWVRSSDHLGVMLDAISAGGAHFVFNGSTGNLTQEWNATGRPFVSLLLGPQATGIESNGTTGRVAVTSEAYLWPNASTPRHLYGNISYGFDAYLLVNFTQGKDGFQSLVYDPWIVFHLAPPTPSGSTPTPFGGSGPRNVAWLVVLGAIGIVAVSVAVGYGRIRQRRRGILLARRLTETDWEADAKGEPVVWRPQ